MLNLSFFQPSLKKVFYIMLFSTFAATIYGTLGSNTILAGSAFISFLLTIVLLTDRKEAVNSQTTNGDTWVTGIALMVLFPLCTAYIAAFALVSLIFNSGFEETLSGILLVLATTTVIFYLIRITSRWFERKGWKLSFYK